MLLKSVLPVMSVYPLNVVSLTSVDYLAGVASGDFRPCRECFPRTRGEPQKKNQNGAFFSSLAASG